MSPAVQLKHQAAIYGSLLGAVLVVLGIASIAAGGYTYMNPPTEEIPPQETDVQQFATSIDHSAEVVESTPLYEPPATIEDQPVYFLNSTPILQINAVAELPDDREVNASHNVIIYREVAFQGSTFWDEQETLATETAIVEDGRLRTEAEIEIPAVAGRNAEIDSIVSGIGSVSTGLRLRTTYETESIDGNPYTGELSAESELEITDRAYWFEDDLADGRTHSQTTGGTVRQQPPDLSLVAGFGLFGIALIGGGIGLVFWSRVADVRGLEERVYRSRYDEWISEGDFPTDAGKQYVYINSLKDLVDIAIDSGKRVIHDPELEIYGVVDDDVIYYHAIDPTTIDSWVNFTRS